MDTRNLRHHKRSKNIKSNRNKGNTDVLVVPPDILKKLGISIGNTNVTQQAHNNTVPSAESIYNGYTTDDPTKINNNRQSSETSILETAKLMKKSVFLSPTFIPTVANVIPGEIEITSIKHPLVMQNVSMDTMEVENMHNQATTGHETWQTDNQISTNGHLTLNGILTTIPEINLKSPKIIENNRTIITNVDNNTEPQSSCLNELTTEKSNTIDAVLTQMEYDATINVVNTSEFSQNLMEDETIAVGEEEGNHNLMEDGGITMGYDESNQNSSEISDSQIKQAERDLISLEGSPIQIDTTEVEDTLISLERTGLQIEQTVTETNIICLEGSTTQIQKPANTLERNIILEHLIQDENKLDSFGESPVYRNPGKMKNRLSSLDETATKKEGEVENNIISMEGNAIQIVEARNVFSTEKNTVLENQIGIENLNSLEDIPIQIEVESDLISLEGSIIQLEQAENIIYLDGNAVLESQTQDENSTMAFEGESVIQVEPTNNIFSLKEKSNQKEVSKNNDIPLEDNLVQKICEDYLNDILAKNGKFELRDDNVNYDLSEDGVIASLPIVNGDFSELAENEILVQVEQATIAQPDINTVPLKTIHKPQVTVNEIAEQIKIISQETLSTQNVPDSKRSRSPIIRALTPVPLNAIIGPRSVKCINKKQNISEVNLPNGTELCNGTEKCYSDTNEDNTTIEKTESIESEDFPEVASICNPADAKISSICNDICGMTMSQPKREERVYGSNLMVGDLKNNNDVISKKVINTCTTANSSENSVTENKSHRDKPVEKKEVNSIRHAYLTLTQGSSIQNYCEEKQNTNECDDEQFFDKSGPGEKRKCIDNLKLSSECKSDNQEIDAAKTIRKKKKEFTKDKSISEKNINDTHTFYPNEQIDKILKSSQENSGMNTSIDKVKEIAECIKKFAQMYKDKKKVSIKGAKIPAANKKEVINLKSNKIKSKLCFQGVEKPGGIKRIEGSDKVKCLKTYSRERKQKELPCSALNISDRNGTIAIVDTTDIELNSIDIQTSYKERDFCLCYDFGRLDICDNSYEHIHFWLHNNNSDLESILNIYNDDVTSHQDRTALDDKILTELTQDDTDTSYICWNYFLNNGDHKGTETSNEMQCTIEKNNSCKSMTKEIAFANDSEDPVQTDANNTSIDIAHSAKLGEPQYNTDYNSKTINVDKETKDEGNGSLETITIIEMEDDHKDVRTSEPHEATEDDLRNIEGEIVGDNNMKTDENNPEASTSNAMKTSEVKQNTTPPLDHNQANSRKRKLSASQSEDATNIDNEEPTSKRKFKCGVCGQLLSETEWDLHVTDIHFDVGWKADSAFNCEDPVLFKKLKKRLRTMGFLQCPVCMLQTKRFYKFFDHLESCIKNYITRRATTSTVSVTCGVCKQNMENASWLEHIEKEHHYLAWIDGTEPLKLDDEEELSRHLQNISKLKDGLICHKCGLKRKRAKIYLAHLETCDGTEDLLNNTAISTDLNSTRDSTDNESIPEKKIVKCGVCAQDVPTLVWTEHIGREHNYLAWADGTPPLNMDDEEEVWKHLQQFIRHNDGLKCYKCGLNRKRVKLFLSHIKTCDGEGIAENEMSMEVVEAVNIKQESSDEKILECAICQAKVPVMEWHEHIGRNHNYLAWSVGETPLDINDQDSVKEHLLYIIRNYEGLICYKCGLNRRRVKLYLSHVETCDGSKNQCDETSSSFMLESSLDLSQKTDAVQCGVCDQELLMMNWIDHIQKEHEYMAWLKSREPLDLANEDVVKAHLMKISREHNGLICNKCGVVMKYPKCFLFHVKECTGPSADNSKEKEVFVSSFDVSDIETETVMCGVCSNEINTSEWLKHLDDAHDYCAWIVGRPPLDFEDSAVMQRHFTEVSRILGGLKCKKCGLIRKYAKAFLQHVKLCGQDETRINLSVAMSGTDPVKCAVCSKNIDPKDWREHAMEEHYNVAWIVGATPIEINNPYGVEPYIKEYQSKHNNKLVCKRCLATRISAVGFYAHIITCGKTEEEMEIYKKVCDICNSKYLCIYKSQHMTMHREKEYAQERKLLLAQAQELKKEEEPEPVVGGRRKAAEKAKTVIEKYTSNRDEEGTHCLKCGFTCEDESEMKDHDCVEDIFQDSDTDASVDLSDCVDDDDDDNLSDIDSNISDEELEAQYDKETKSKKHGEHSGANKIQRLPYQIRNINNYMRRSAEQFIKLHLTNDDLFPHWRSLDYEVVPETELQNYMPPLEESCKIKYSDKGDWTSYKRFTAEKQHDVITMFSGACIQSICWVPPCIGENEAKYEQYLSVVTHLDSDVPRHMWHEKPSPKPALIQIWNCGNLLAGVPEFTMGVALDCGVIWAIDWCPSGARDILNANETVTETNRLGLFAVACANGSAYVFAMPHPSPIKEKGHRFCKLKPVVEMRLAMNANRKVHQATAIRWSSQKGHAHIVVGYSDGTVAYYDLLNESPLLRSTENNVTILYPYYDKRAQSICIEELDMFPRLATGGAAGAVASGSVAGAGVRAAPPHPAHAPPAHSAATRVRFSPHWPAALLAGDDNLVSQAVNEVEWYGGGRRVGSMRACCVCAWCGRVGAAAAPLLRVMRTHPAHHDLHRQVIATLKMVPFGNKRKRKNDELSMIMEPLTYNDAVLKYGIEFQRITAKDKHTQQKLSGLPRETYPERFPLSDVAGMMFCPSSRNHHKLTVATHAGLIFIVSV